MHSRVHNSKRIGTTPLARIGIAFILAFSTLAATAEPPKDLARRVAQREDLSEAERSQYTYKQWFTFEEFDHRGNRSGMYQERREVIFLANGERVEKLTGKPSSTLERIRMTDEDFRDIRDIQGGLFTAERLGFYETKPKGEEVIDGIACWVLQVRPRQILDGMRMFEGLFWVDQRDFSIVRSEGRAVPQLRSSKPGKENLFAHFTTVREKVGDFWFPVMTFADDTLDFNSGPVRVKFTIRYREYKRFRAASKITPDSDR
jgi:hypothetical protein